MPLIEYIKDCRVHVFICGARPCKREWKTWRTGPVVFRYRDKKSMSNLQHHTRGCWGDEVVKAADNMRDVFAACEAMAKVTKRDGSITSAFEHIGKQNQITYSHRQHISAEVQVEVVCWVAEKMRPFLIVSDQSLLKLLKTRRPDYCMPSPHTVSRNVKNVFVHCHQRIARMLQVCITSGVCSQLRNSVLKYAPGARWLFEFCY